MNILCNFSPSGLVSHKYCCKRFLPYIFKTESDFEVTYYKPLTFKSLKHFVLPVGKIPHFCFLNFRIENGLLFIAVEKIEIEVFLF